jgi:lipid A 3-O-deacylase
VPVASVCAAGFSTIPNKLPPKTRSMRILIAGMWLCCTSLCFCQTRPENGGHEVQVWTGGGPSVSGGTSDTSVWNTGLRYGWILTRPHGLGFLNGRFEYVVDAVPMFLVIQPHNTAYGAGINPLGLKWNFAARGRIEPYFELNGGTLFTTHEVPSGTSSVNFTSAAALGMHVLGDKHAFSVEVRYMHISNAGLASPNPGINTVQVRLGIGKFFGK